MSMLARYKKGGGIIELVKMIEESPDAKRAQLLAMIRNEDADFAAKVESRLFSFDQLKALGEDLIAEIVGATPVKFMAIILANETDPNFVTLAERCLGKNFAEYKGERELVASAPVAPAQVDAARKKMIAEARKLEAEGKIKLPFTDAVEGSGSGAKLNTGAAPTGPVGTATEELAPPIESFGIEAPPPGLAGERLEVYFKSQLEKA